MSAQTYPRDDEQQPLEGLESPGKRLRIARQAKGMTQDDVASHLHLSRSIIETLENDNYDRLPGPVFVRGYLRNYARLMGLDDAAILAGYGDAHLGSQTPAPVHQGVEPEIRSSHLGVRLVSLALGVSLLSLLVAWWQGYLEWNNDVLDQAMEAELHAPEAGEGGNPSLGLPQPYQAPERLPQISDSGEEPPADVQSPEAAPITEAADGQPKPAAETAVIAETEQPTTAVSETTPQKPDQPENGDESARPEIVFEFLGTCWVDIRDSTRKFKLFGEMNKGKPKVLGGTPPYSVILGNSAMVRVTIDGEPFDIESLSRGSVARFSLDPSSAN